MSRGIKFRAWDKDEIKYVDGVGNLYMDIIETGTNVFGIVQMCPGRYIIEQDTGLKDKNGKEIYEGDIVCFNADYPLVVVWHKTAFRLKNDVGVGCPIGELEPCEVIGNIHENPELLEGEK